MSILSIASNVGQVVGECQIAVENLDQYSLSDLRHLLDQVSEVSGPIDAELNATAEAVAMLGLKSPGPGLGPAKFPGSITCPSEVHSLNLSNAARPIREEVRRRSIETPRKILELENKLREQKGNQ